MKEGSSPQSQQASGSKQQPRMSATLSAADRAFVDESYEEALAEIERIKAPVIGRVSHDCGDATCPRRGPVIESPTCKRAEEFERQISPLAALEAAERLLLEAGGWTIAELGVIGRPAVMVQSFAARASAMNMQNRS